MPFILHVTELVTEKLWLAPNQKRRALGRQRISPVVLPKKLQTDQRIHHGTDAAQGRAGFGHHLLKGFRPLLQQIENAMLDRRSNDQGR